MKKYLLTLYLKCGVIIEKELLDNEDHKAGNTYAIFKYYMENKAKGVVEVDNMCVSIRDIVAFEIKELED